jgi:NAD(P)H-hydrate epimerase
MYDCFEADEGMTPETFADRLMWGDYLVAGPGLSKDGRARRMVRAFETREAGDALKDKKLIVFDADALNIMAEEGIDPGTVRVKVPATGDGDGQDGSSVLAVITPHVAEMARLTGLSIGEIKADPAEVAASYADAHGVLVVLKDARTAVAAPGRAAAMIDSGCGAMAKAGSGDVLCGFISGYTAMLHGCVEDAVPLAVFMHGIAGCAAAEKTGEHSLLARDIAEAAGEVLARVLSEI